MKVNELKFELRSEYPELQEEFFIFNKMVLDGNTAKVSIVEETVSTDVYEYFLCISIYRCKKNMPSCGTKRAIIRASFPIFEQDNIISKDLYPCFNVDSSGKEITISLYNTLYENPLFDLPLKSAIIDNFSDFLSLKFYSRKQFPELSQLLNIANKMLHRGASTYLSIRNTGKSHGKFLNIKIMFENLDFPSFFINIGLLVDLIYDNILLETSKANFITCKIPSVAPVFIECESKFDDLHGSIIRVHIGRSENEKEQSKIEKQCDILNSIFPQ